MTSNEKFQTRTGLTTATLYEKDGCWWVSSSNGFDCRFYTRQQAMNALNADGYTRIK